MEKQVHTYFVNNNIIPSNQSDFRSEYSCSTALSDMMKARDCGDESVNMILVTILKYICFQMSVSSLVYSFLCNRKQSVCLDGEVSSNRAIKSGVPLCSILGPVSYNIYTFKIWRTYHFVSEQRLFYVKSNLFSQILSIKLF